MRYERDLYFEEFIDVFGEATSHKPVPKKSVEKYRGVLPDLLLTYWENEGWNGYLNGILWIVDPEDYEGVLKLWLENTPLAKKDRYYVYARTAFGELFVISEKTKQTFSITPFLNSIFYIKEDMTVINDEPVASIRCFFGFAKRNEFDIKSDNGGSLFDKALKRLGPCNENEMYTFVPPMLMGGALEEKDLKKVNIFVQLDILANLSDERTLSSD